MSSVAGRVRRPKPVAPLEHHEQVAFVQWFRLQHPRVLIYAIPNGASLAGDEKQRAILMGRLKAEGLTPGVPDLHIPAWSLYIEMKRVRGGRISPEQREIHAELRASGNTVIVATGSMDAIGQLRVILRERGAA